MTITREIIIDALKTLDIFYCEPTENTIYVTAYEGAENNMEVEAIYGAIGANSDNGWCICLNAFGLPQGREVCTLHGLTVEWKWEAWE
jgi:hypothetical protein